MSHARVVLQQALWFVIRHTSVAAAAAAAQVGRLRRPSGKLTLQIWAMSSARIAAYISDPHGACSPLCSQEARENVLRADSYYVRTRAGLGLAVLAGYGTCVKTSSRITTSPLGLALTSQLLVPLSSWIVEAAREGREPRIIKGQRVSHGPEHELRCVAGRNPTVGHFVAFGRGAKHNRRVSHKLPAAEWRAFSSLNAGFWGD